MDGGVGASLCRQIGGAKIVWLLGQCLQCGLERVNQRAIAYVGAAVKFHLRQARLKGRDEGLAFVNGLACGGEEN